jgi:hypothetical protein
VTWTSQGEVLGASAAGTDSSLTRETFVEESSHRYGHYLNAIFVSHKDLTVAHQSLRLDL